MSARSALEARLKEAGAQPDAAFDIAETALILAAFDHPATPLDAYRQHLATLANDLADAGPGAGEPREQAQALGRVLFERHGYRGDAETYDDPENADLMRVIDRRKGLPVSLGILAIHAARAQGWNLVGLRFPGHFLVRLEGAGERAVLDPFDGFKRLDAGAMRELLKGVMGPAAELAPELYAPASDHEVLIRLQNNIKSRALQSEDLARAQAVLERMVLFAPNEPELWRELGLVSARQGQLGRALAALEEALAKSRNDEQRRQADRLLARLKASLN